MKMLELVISTAGGLAASVVGMASPVAAAPSAADNAQAIVRNLEAQGYRVIINHLGNTPLDKATVVAVRPGQTFTRTDSGNPGDNRLTLITGKTVYVDVK